MNTKKFDTSESVSSPVSYGLRERRGEPTLDTRSLRYFIALAEERHFGRAALRLHIAQPALSRHLKHLESTLHTQLLIRTTRRVTLTHAGEMLLARGRKIIGELQDIEDDLHRIGTGLVGHVRLGFTGSATYGIMPAVVRWAREELPDITLSLRGEMLTPSLETDLIDRKLDFAVLRPHAEHITHSELTIENLAVEPIVAAIPSSSEWAHTNETLEMSIIAQMNLIGYPLTSATARQIAATAPPAMDFSTRAPETSTILSLVAAGVGASLVPASARALQLPGVIFRDVIDAPTVNLAIAWRNNNRNPALHRILPLLRKAVRHHAEVYR